MRSDVLSRLAIIALITLVALAVNFAPNDRLFGRDVSTRLGLDLRGGAQLILQPREGSPSAEDMEAAAGVVERRVNGLGLSETVVQTAGANNERIIVELPGEKDPESATQLLQGTGSLEYIDPQGQQLPPGTVVCTTENPSPPAQADAAAGTTLQSTGGLTGTGAISPTTTPAATTPTTPTQQTCDTIYETISKGSELDTGSVALTNDQLGRPAVLFKFLGQSATNMQVFTARNVGRPMSIVLDNVVISSPTIQDVLPGEGIITFGNQSAQAQRQEAQTLLGQLKYGALPVPLEVTSVRSVTATLGEASVRASLVAGVVGLLAVAVFMIIFYHLPGLLAVMALLIYTAILFAIYRLVPITLTLPGIAGFILSIGLAVDANVLIFARLKEELRMGRPLLTAIERGFDHAWPSIRDSNAATFITSVILFAFGSSFGVSLIKGFALTLIIGVAVSLFTAVYVTRTFLRMTVGWQWARKPFWFGIEERSQFEPDSSTS